MIAKHVDLLDAIRAIHAGVGDGLNDHELTWFLHRSALPAEAGFAFLSYAGRFVTFTVPHQEMAGWYPEQGWIAAEKEGIARAIAEKHGLSLCKPPDAVSTCLNTLNPHHHLEMSNQRETIIVVHPQYLKVRLFVATDPARYEHAAQRLLPFGLNLLQDLSALYQV